MAVEYITIAGKKHPLQFGYEVYETLQKKHNIQIDDISSVNWSNYKPALFYSLKMGAEAKGEKFEWKLTDMTKALNECIWEFIQLMPKFFPTFDDELAKKSVATGKKPPTGRTRKPKS